MCKRGQSMPSGPQNGAGFKVWILLKTLENALAYLAVTSATVQKKVFWSWHRFYRHESKHKLDYFDFDFEADFFF
jgi:hypothetical protein